jgi:hypothetical protein
MADLLDDLNAVAGLEHAVVVEALVLRCALGADPALDQPSEPTAADIASAAMSMSQTAMFQFRRANDVIVLIGESPTTARATSFVDDAGVTVALDPPGGAQLAGYLTRLAALARALTRAYRALARSAPPSGSGPGEVSEAVQQLIDAASPYEAVVDDMQRALGGASLATLLRVTRRDPHTPLEEGLLAAGDRAYGLVLSLLLQGFQQPDPFVGGAFRRAAVDAMFLLDQANTNLVRGTVLPVFTAP